MVKSANTTMLEKPHLQCVLLCVGPPATRGVPGVSQSLRTGLISVSGVSYLQLVVMFKMSARTHTHTHTRVGATCSVSFPDGGGLIRLVTCTVCQTCRSCRLCYYFISVVPTVRPDL